MNARDMGGYVLSDGKTVKKGLLLRGGCLNKAADDDIRRLEEIYNVTSIFDYRTEGEVSHAPDRQLKNCTNLWLPTIDDTTEKAVEFTLPKEAYRDLERFVVNHASDPEVQSVARKMYPALVRNEYTQLQYAVFLQRVTNQESGAIYLHCSQGKDRTGMGAAFLLAALGADRELILKDFELSNEYYKDLIDRLCAEVVENGGWEEELKVVMTFIGVNVDYFCEALDIIDQEYGGMNQYLHNELCLTDDDIQQLKSRYLE